MSVAQEWGLLEVVPRVKQLKAPRTEIDFLTFGGGERLVMRGVSLKAV